ncbi:MAG: acyltransferase family protein [Candidatus Phlomobacter fragariae]
MKNVVNIGLARVIENKFWLALYQPDREELSYDVFNYGDNGCFYFFFYYCLFFQKITTSNIGERYYFLGGLRGICAIFVIITHSHTLLGLKGFNLNGYVQNSISFTGGISVQIFFCITGFLFIDQIIKKI